MGVFSINTDSRDIIEQYIDNTDRIENLHRYLDEDVIKGNKLIVFIDDLDRCSVENALNILESIKIFLSTNNTTFIVGADLEKLEKAWELRYGKRSMIHTNEAKNHIDKIFQLSISLPTKDHANMQEYMNSLEQNDGFLNTSMKQLILFGCKANPRSFKRILNLINILWFLCKKYNIETNNNMAIITSLAIISVQYPPLLKLFRITPKSFFELALLAINYDSHDNLKKYEKLIKNIDYSNLERHVSPTQLKTLTNVHSISALQANTIKGLEYLLENEYAFGLMKAIGKNNHFRDADNVRLQKIGTEKGNEIENISKLVDSSTLFI